jgi:hypothetical protein
MQVRIWQSFSSNNSSNFRLVARFGDATKASEVAAELQALRGDGALPRAIGFDWDEWFPYGDEEDPTIAAEGEVLAVYHSYCLGYPEEFTGWLRARGGAVEPQKHLPPQVSVLFRLPPASDALRHELSKILKPEDPNEKNPWDSRIPGNVEMPWNERAPSSIFCDGDTAGFSVPIRPMDLPVLKQWLKDRGVSRPTLRLCAYDDTAKFATIAAARCSGCGGSLRYIEPTRFGLDAEQLGCGTCGAMYELSVIRAAAEPRT